MSTFVPRRALAITPHADDITLFAGGTLASWVEEDCDVLVVRVTQDEKDSFILSPEQAAAINLKEFHLAMRTLGVQETCDLDYRDCELMDAPYGELREKMIRKIREFKPQIIVSFDPATADDENPDHIVTAKAAADASWAAGYPNFHPEHMEQGLEPHTPLGQYYFTRHFVHGETVVNIERTLEKKIQAVLEHKTMLVTAMMDQKRRLEAAGFGLPFIKNRNTEDYADYWKALLFGAAQQAAKNTDYDYAEKFRSTLITADDPLVRLLSSLS